jgi:hypothetical protein
MNRKRRPKNEKGMTKWRREKIKDLKKKKRKNNEN